MKLFNFEGNKIVNWLLLTAFSSVVLSTFTFILPETLLYLCSIIILFLASYRTLFNGTTLWFLFFQTIVLIDCIFGKGLMPLNSTLINTMLLLVPIIASNYYMRESLNDWTKVAIILLFLVTFSCVITFFISLTLPIALRTIMTTETSEYGKIQTQYSLMGMITYMEGHAIPLLLPILVFWFRTTRKYSILFIVLLVLYILFSATITTAFFIGLLTTLISFLFNVRKSKIYNFMMILGLALIITISNFLMTQGFLDFLSSYSNEIMYEKIGDISLTLQGGEGEQVANRQFYFFLSWDSFIKNPLLGNWDKSLIGGHSFFIDYLSYYGLVIFSVFIVFLYQQIKKPIECIRKEVRPYYYLSLIYYIVMGFLKGAPGHLTYLFLFIILPGLAIYVSKLYEYSEETSPVIPVESRLLSNEL